MPIQFIKVILGCLLFQLLLSVSRAAAQDSTPPTITLNSLAVIPNGENFDFIFLVKAADETELEGLEFRGKVDGRPLDPFFTYPYIEGFPLVITVRCTTFRFDIRSVDAAGNTSSIIKRDFRAPFTADDFGLIQKPPGVPFVPDATIEEAPAIVVRGTSALVLMQRFVASRRVSLIRNLDAVLSRAGKRKSRKLTVNYQVTTTSATTGDIRRKQSKKNALSVGNLSPGSYSTTYRVELKRGRKVIAQTQESPAATFSVG